MNKKDLLVNLDKNNIKSHIQDFVFNLYLKDKDFSNIQSNLHIELARIIAGGKLHSYSIALSQEVLSININGPLEYFGGYVGNGLPANRTWSESILINKYDILDQMKKQRNEKINSIFQSQLF